MLHDQIIAKRYMDINNNNELQTHQGMDAIHMSKPTVLRKIELREHSTQYKHCYR